MITNFRTAIVLAAAVCGSVAHLSGQTQNPPPVAGQGTSAQAAEKSAPLLTALVEYPSSETDKKEAAKTAADAATSTAAAKASEDAKPADANAASADPASVKVSLKNEAVINEITEIKKQFAQMQDAMKARISKLESELNPGAVPDEADSAARDASALRSAEKNEMGGEPGGSGQVATLRPLRQRLLRRKSARKQPRRVSPFQETGPG